VENLAAKPATSGVKSPVHLATRAAMRPAREHPSASSAASVRSRSLYQGYARFPNSPAVEARLCRRSVCTVIGKAHNRPGRCAAHVHVRSRFESAGSTYVLAALFGGVVGLTPHGLSRPAELHMARRAPTVSTSRCPKLF